MPKVEQNPPIFHFGVFDLDTRTRELRKHGVKLKLQDQPLQILTLLLERPGEIVTREEIQKRLWPDNTHVDFDNAINSAIRKLRDALGDSPENPRFVETLARRGYRFIAPVSRPLSVPFQDAPPALASQPVNVPVAPSPPAAQKRRLLWIACTLAVVLGAIAVALWSWTSKSNQARNQMALPAVPLTGNRGYEEYPAFSPEGTRVAFAWTEPGMHVPHIYVKLIGEGGPIQLTTNPAGDFAPAWSPDGHWIAFLRVRERSQAAVIVMPSLGGQEREVTQVSLDTNEMLRHWETHLVPSPYLAWSRDGRWLLSVEEKTPDEVFSIARVSVETGGKRTLTSPPKGTKGDGALAISPDGKTLAFTRTLGVFEKEIYTVSISEDLLPRGEPRRLTFDNAYIDGLAWTPDGRSLIFSSMRGGRFELWRMPVSPAGEPVRLIAAGDDPRDVAMARQGSHLVYSHVRTDWHIWRMRLERNNHLEQPRSFISSARREHLPKYSPDGTRIAFESGRSGNEEIWMCNADGSHPVQLTAFRHAWSGSPRWSPDGQKIAFDSNAAGNWDIYVIGSQGGHAVRLTTTESQECRPSWSHDGKWVYFCSSRTGQPQVWKIPAAGGVAVPVTKNGGGVAFESTDGEDLYYTKATKDQQLWKMPVRGGNETRVLNSVLDNNFAVLKRGIYFLAGAPSDANLHLQFLSFATRTIQTLGTVPGPSADEIDVSPDERWLLYATTGGGSDLMLIENVH